MKIYLIDIIGTHSGTFYYNKAFHDVLRKKFPDVEIVSNYSGADGSVRRVFLNYYSGNAVLRIIKLATSLLRFLSFVIRNRENCFIFMTYGNAYEIIFLLPMLLARMKIIDVHEIISLIDDKGSNKWIRRVYARLIYRRVADAVIIHSKRSSDFLDEFGFKRVKLEVPHFSYQDNSESNEEPVKDEVRALVSARGINILFFGFIRRSKGTGILTEIISEAGRFDPDQKLNFIVAGNDPDNLLLPLRESIASGNKLPVSLLLRYFEDRELNYLFRNCDYVFLPYLQISQSGVLEMAIRFRKPVITSDLPYFKDILEMFPSFGYSCKSNEPDEYLKLFRKILEVDDSDEKLIFYHGSDLTKFDSFKDPDHFLTELETMLSHHK